MKNCSFLNFGLNFGLIFGLFLGLPLSSCSTGFNANDLRSGFTYNEIVVVNRSRVLIEEVTISADASGRSFNCGNVVPMGLCSDKFSPRRYEKNPIRITWVIDGTTRHSEEHVVEVPATFVPGLPLRGVLDISPRGVISAYFQQEEPM